MKKFLLLLSLIVVFLTSCADLNEAMVGDYIENEVVTMDEENPYEIKKTYEGYFESDCVEEDWARILYGLHKGECRCESLRSVEDWNAVGILTGKYCKKENYGGYGCFIDIETNEPFGEKCNFDLYYERAK